MSCTFGKLGTEYVRVDTTECSYKKQSESTKNKKTKTKTKTFVEFWFVQLSQETKFRENIRMRISNYNRDPIDRFLFSVRKFESLEMENRIVTKNEYLYKYIFLKRYSQPYHRDRWFWFYIRPGYYKTKINPRQNDFHGNNMVLMYNVYKTMRIVFSSVWKPNVAPKIFGFR